MLRTSIVYVLIAMAFCSTGFMAIVLNKTMFLSYLIKNLALCSHGKPRIKLHPMIFA